MSTEELHHEVQVWHDTTYDIRTTRRDLEALTKAKLVAIGNGPNHRSKYWKLGKGRIDLSLSATESMTLTAIFQHAERFGFSAETEQLTRLRDYAASEIRRSTRNLLAEGRITTGTRFTVLRPGNYKADHLELIQKAMLDDASLEVVYLPRDAGDVQCTYLLKPLALSYQDSNIYLSAYVKSETWPEGSEPPPGAPRGKYSSNGPGTTCALMLHRMVSVKSHWEKIPDPENYDVQSIEVQKDLMTVHTKKPVGLKLRLSPNLHNRLSENPLTADQVLTQGSRGWVLECQLLDTQGLRLFLLSNAADIEVLAPQQLRSHVLETLKKAVEKYGPDD